MLLLAMEPIHTKETIGLVALFDVVTMIVKRWSQNCSADGLLTAPDWLRGLVSPIILNLLYSSRLG